jgi:hypothetical protein
VIKCIYSDNPCPEGGLNRSIRDVFLSVSPAKILRVMNNVFGGCDTWSKRRKSLALLPVNIARKLLIFAVK